MQLDAKDFGPAKRDRLYWTNILLTKAEAITNITSETSACDLLEEGYTLPEIICKEAKQNTEVIIPKANTFMASKSRIDDARMTKVRKFEGNYWVSSYSVGERELMAGLPIGYVSNAVKELFEELRDNAFLKPEVTIGSNWRTFLSEELHHFRTECKFKIKPDYMPPWFCLEISTPKESDDFYNEEEYCKRLIGNGWSIPVIEYILGSLKEICEEDWSHQEYNYRYQWRPYNCND